MMRAAFIPVAAALIMAAAPATPAQPLDTGDYAAVLSAFVDGDGRVDYAGLKENRAPLDAFARALAELDAARYDAWSEAEQIATWINAYNALTLVLIVDYYPIQSSRIKSLVYPKNSIRQIAGAWDGVMFEVMEEKVTLDHIEHAILRTRYAEPRVHMALVCAAVSCPRLRGEPYTGARLDEQLDDQARRFLCTRGKFALDRKAGTVRLSAIFDWFGGDFVARYGEGGNGHVADDEERAVVTFVSGYLNEADRRYLLESDYAVKYFDYDWTLNEQPVR
ncbi:MAG: DUF547 domain-containing protein [Candidatus Krumholzibacteria bacterium]|nr:DUF547 domain-containing protein [Candidatus Krumholzibacteria bacterium]